MLRQKCSRGRYCLEPRTTQKMKRSLMCTRLQCGKSFLVFSVFCFLVCLQSFFSFSVWEIATRDIPWEGSSTQEVQRRVSGGERLPLPNAHENRIEQVLNDLIAVCWAQDIHVRPHFKDIRTRLDSLGFEQQQ